MSITDPSQADESREEEPTTMVVQVEPIQEQTTPQEAAQNELETTMGASQSLPEANAPTTVAEAEHQIEAVKDEPGAPTETAEPPPSAENTEPQVESEPAQSSTPIFQKKKLCGVCNKQEGRYNCVRCGLPFCSIACNNIHKESHPAITPNLALPPKPPIVLESNGSARPGTVAGAGVVHPFAILDNNNELQTLFKLYPTLPSLLTEIHSATLRPLAENSSNRKNKYDEWNSDKGIQKGVDILHRIRDTEDKDGEAVREYCNLILHLLEDGEDRRAREVIQRELLEENKRVIEDLLQSERG